MLKIKKYKLLISLFQVGIVTILCIVATILYIPSQDVSSADQVRQQYEQDIAEIKAKIQATDIHLDGVVAERITLEQTLNNLNTQITNLQELINRTQAEVDRLDAEFEQLEEDLEVQTKILERILSLLYKQSGASSFELIITSDNFSSYLNKQEYLNRLRQGVIESVDRIERLQAHLKSQREYYENLLEEQQTQQVVLNASNWEQQQLLYTTNNEEQQFQAQLNRLRIEQQQLEDQLEAYLNNLITNPQVLATVAAGDIIGKNGNTGWSTGPHLHLAIYSASDTSIKYDPQVFMRNNNLIWPMGGNGGWVSQGYHGGHRALDIAAAEGTAVKAIAAGTIVHRGCLFTDLAPQYSTFGIIIDHGSYLSLYIHLQAPNSEKYSDCNINRRSQYGTYSIDYSVTD